jgi:hypothetical protein
MGNSKPPLKFTRPAGGGEGVVVKEVVGVKNSAIVRTYNFACTDWVIVHVVTGIASGLPSSMAHQESSAVIDITEYVLEPLVLYKLGCRKRPFK